jgi:lipopolysaccharide biosynthesis glycosyltransferase
MSNTNKKSADLIKAFELNDQRKEAMSCLIGSLPIRQSKYFFCYCLISNNEEFKKIALTSFLSRLKTESNPLIGDISLKLHEACETFDSDSLRLLAMKASIDCGNLAQALNVAQSQHDHNKQQYFTCVYLTYSKNYTKALVLYKDIILTQDYPDLLFTIIQHAEYNDENKEIIKSLIETINSNNKYHIYHRCINTYIKNLIHAKEICNIEDIDVYTSSTKINTFIIAEMLFSQKRYEELYEYLVNNLEKISSFYPLGNWLIEAASAFNKTNELLTVLQQSKKNLSQIQIQESLLELMHLPSSRLYKYDGDLCDQEYNVMFCTNFKYYQGFKAALSSLVLNNSNIKDCLNIYVFVDESLDVNHVSRFTERLGVKVKIFNIDKTYDTKSVKIEYGIKNTRILDRSAYYRIFALEFLLHSNEETANKIEQILYLDSDLIVLSSIKSLFNQHKDMPVYGCLENEQETLVAASKKINNLQTYVNSGVLLFNTKHSVFDACLKTTMDATETPEKLMLHDQCSINIGFNKNIGTFATKYNHMMHMQNTEFLKKNIDILHFTGAIKPWQPSYHSCEFLSKLWYSYYKIAENLKFVYNNTSSGR